MCGRYALLADPADLVEGFDMHGPSMPLDFRPSYNAAPSQLMPVVLLESGRRIIRLHRWGLIPSWAKDPSVGNQLINARAETIAEKPSFRNAFKKHRCLVPASGFFEWAKTAAGKVPHFIRPRDGGLIAFAGLWESWTDPAGEPMHSYTIVTTGPNATMAGIHDRMPVILPREHYDAWLDVTRPADAALALLRPAPDDALEAYPVSRQVNSPAVNEPGNVERVPTEKPRQGSLL